jgi:DNA-binding transcriptional regulator YiaG
VLAEWRMSASGRSRPNRAYCAMSGLPLIATSTTPKADENAKPTRFSAKGLQAQRSRIGVSQTDFGKLLGVSAQSIYNWESEKARPRAEQIGQKPLIEYVTFLGSVSDRCAASYFTVRTESIPIMGLPSTVCPLSILSPTREARIDNLSAD